MKGLCLGNLEKKEEGYEHVRRAIKINPKSHVCWHVLGLLNRADRNYEGAIKSYKVALRCDPGNHQIYRDMAVLQLQTRQFDDHLESRLTILNDRPMVKSNWIALAIAYHLCGKLDKAIETIDTYLKEASGATGVLATSVFDNELGQVHLYKSMLLEESGDLQGCFEHLETVRFMAGDILAHSTRKARLLLKLGNITEAEKLYYKLFAYIPENLEFLKGLESCSCVDLQREDTVIKFMNDNKEKFPASSILKLRYLPYLNGESFVRALKAYAIPLLKKGAPSLFHSIKSLYSSPEKVSQIEELSKEICGNFESLEDYKSLFWGYYFLAQHFDKLGNPEESLKYLDKAYALDSKIPDLFILYGRVLKHSGKLHLASNCMEYARKMDLGDRFLNTKSVKYLLRAGKIEQSKNTVALFIKGDSVEQKLKDFSEIQCLWFDFELGKALKRNGDASAALEQFQKVYKNFEDFVDDQLDFHNYVLRKMSLTVYVDMLRYLDTIQGHQMFLNAGIEALQCILKLLSKSSEKQIEQSLADLSLSSRPDYIQMAKNWLILLQKFHGNNNLVKEIAQIFQKVPTINWKSGDIIESKSESFARYSIPMDLLMSSPFLSVLVEVN
jgi:peptide alpha-N-acetyltransferase